MRTRTLSGGLARVTGAVAVLLLATGALAACSESSDDKPSTGGSGSGDASAAIVAEAQQATDALFDTGSETPPPADGPAGVKGKTVWVVSCGQAVTGCSLLTDAAVTASKQIGWKTTLCDGNFNAGDQYGKCIRQAVAAGADGIILNSVDCVAVTQPLKEAKAAGVKVAAVNTFPCDGANADLATMVVPSTATPTIDAYGQAAGKAQADYLIATSKGKAKVLNFRFVDNFLAIEVNKGFEAEMATCGTCSVKNTDITLADYVNPSTFGQKSNAALLSAPDATAVHVPFDSFLTSGVGQAITSAGRAGKLDSIGFNGFEANLNLIRDGKGQTAALGADQEWAGWAAADTMNRLLAGAEPVAEGMGFKMVDADKNLPSSGSYRSDIDFKAAYEAVWSK
ncbi:MAG: substrate-binding domain-containing protein [Nocardioidaceae bacterium]|nr:substrate-binding domain-containing protein [Nocardioidaceae bacterium]